MTDEPFQFASQVYRSALQVLEARGWWTTVRTRLSQQTLTALRDLPLIGFVDGTMMEEINVTLLEIHGKSSLEQFADGCTRAALENLRMHALLEGLIRMWGPSPAFLFSKMNATNSKSVKGQLYHWTEIGPKAGYVDVSYPGRREIPHAAQLGVYYGMRSLLKLIGREAASVDRLALHKTSPREVVYRTTVRWV